MHMLQVARRGWRAFLSVGLGALLVACGGGGGDGSPAPSSGATSTFSSVSVGLASAAPVQATLFEGSLLNPVSLDVVASGDIGALNGKTIFVIVEDPASLFEPVPFVSLHDAPPGAFIGLRGQKLDVPGRRQGNVKIHACLDAACASELAGSPMAVPFDVTVRPGLTLDRQAINLTLPFGQVPPVQTVTATLPPFLASWGAADSTPFAPVEPRASMLVSTRDDGASAGSVSLAVAPARPGTYVLSANVFTNTSDPAGVPLHFDKTVTVTYTVTPDPSVDFVFFPAAGNFTRVQGDPLADFSIRMLVTNDGVTATGAGGVEYLSHPPAADGHPMVNGWWNEGVQVATGVCLSNVDGIDCLPPGTYTARVRRTLRKGGVDQDVFWPITLEIVPR